MSITNNQNFLNRWLSVNGPTKLRRIRGLLTMPDSSMSIPNALWDGLHSVRVIQFNYFTPNKFTLILDEESNVGAAGDSLCWCIRNTNNSSSNLTSETKRYKLNTAGEILYAPMYNGEVLNPYVELEAWTTPVFASPLSIGIPTFTLKTSVLGDKDIMNGEDFALSEVLYTNQVVNDDFKFFNAQPPGSFSLPFSLFPTRFHAVGEGVNF